ncbi:strychnine-11-hydroxylase-like [Primulina eburnea]|uniref:strychnine-11-hydroxylase-like n=1 Tax=Primulina eburnea TaxID=1245227 RepID=UPI003C6CBF8B
MGLTHDPSIPGINCPGHIGVSSAPYGEYWREARKVVVLELLTIKRVQSFQKIVDQELALMINKVTHTKSPVDLSATIFSLINNIIRRVAFGTRSDLDHGKSDEISAKFQEIFLETQHLLGEFNIADYFPSMAWINKFNGVDKRIGKNLEDFDMFFDKVMEEHLVSKRAKSDYEDIVDVLLEIKMDTNQAIIKKNEHIKGILIDVFVAGSDTSTATIIWTMAELIRNPRVKEKAQQEVRNICKGKLKVEENDINKLPYLKLTVKESLRLHPPAPLMIPRETIQDCTISNKYEIPTKTRVIFNAAAIGMDPNYWKNPEEFWPDRFLNRDIDFRGQHFELLPFGAGRRGCPGISFAISIVELTLANLLFQFDWELPKGILAENISMEEQPGITMHKKVPLCLVASPAKLG